MTKLIITAAAALGLVLGVAQPAMATTPTQCSQAQAAVAKLRALSASYATTNPALSKAYASMADSEQRALAYYC